MIHWQAAILLSTHFAKCNAEKFIIVETFYAIAILITEYKSRQRTRSFYYKKGYGQIDTITLPLNNVIFKTELEKCD